MDPRWLRNSFIYLLILVAIVAIFFTVFPPTQGGRESDISTVLDMARSGAVDRIEVQGDMVSAVTKDGEKLRSRKEPGTSMLEILDRAGIKHGAGGVAVDIKEPG